MLKVTMNADNRNEILSTLGSLRMIFVFFKSEQKHQSNKEKILDKSGIIYYLSLKQNSGINTESESGQRLCKPNE